MINFYNYIHSNLTKEITDELIVWPGEILDRPSTFTNKDLLQGISNYRQLLLHKNIKPGEAVLLAMPVSIAAVNILLATQSIGAIPVLPPSKPGLLTLTSVIQKQKIRAVITEKKPGFLLSFALRTAGIQRIGLQNAGIEASSWMPLPVPGTQAALVTHTSGSTGKPKAVYRSHQVLSAQHIALKKIFPPWPG